MTDEEMDFCHECGMEFPNGPEEVCPLCGNEITIIENDPLDLVDWVPDGMVRCAVCRGWCPEDDWRFKFYWRRFDSPAWLTLDEPWCNDCVMDGIRKQYPGLEKSGLEPDTYLIWEKGLEMGIDLGPHLRDIDFYDTAFQLHNKRLSREQIVHWLSWGCPVTEVVNWVDVTRSYKMAMKWREAGFPPDEDTGIWISWGCSPNTASKYLEQGISYPPGTDYKKLGISLRDAIYFDSNDFSSIDGEVGRYNIRTWLPSRLSPEHIVRLRDEIDEREDTFEELHYRSRSRQSDGDRLGDFWEFLPKQFEQLNALGLHITVENLQKYWGLSSDEILKVIDVGGSPGVAADLIRRGASVGKMGVVERLLNLGVQQELATSLATRGFLVKHLKQIETKGDALAILDRLGDVLGWLEEGATVEDAIPWLEVEGPAYQIRSWSKQGFASREAANWAQEGFTSEDAKLWRDSGVDSPVVAKRRREAGIQPTPKRYKQ